MNKKLIAEALGTAILVLFGGGAAVIGGEMCISDRLSTARRPLTYTPAALRCIFYI